MLKQNNYYNDARPNVKKLKLNIPVETMQIRILSIV